MSIQAMAHSPSSDRRAQLIREMSRDLGRTRPSSRSSQGSNGKAEYTTSDFDPENEALMSTQQLESTTQRLPELRASAQKYSRYNQPEPDFAINTSAIGRAFPDFTQGATSSDDDSMSIEIGRGVPRAESGKNEKLGRSSSKIGENSMDFSPAMIGNYQVMSTPPRRPSTTSKPATNTANDSLRRNAQVRRASAVQQETKKASQATAKATDYGSGGSRQGSAEHRRTLGSMHARVADEDAASDISDDRPQTLTLTARNTRFGNGRGVQAPILNNLPSKYTSAQGLVDALSQETVAKNRKAKAPIINGTLSSVNACTQQSFLLPDIPNVSELVSGVFEDGTPVFSRHGKPRSSRFASGVHSQPRKDYANVAGIPVPDEEQAIFVSLRLLQDKVAELENGKAEAEATMQELQDKNLILEREKTESKRFRRADSALGTTDGSDGSDDAGRGPRKWIIEKTRRESTIRTLQEQASAALHKNSVSGITIKNLTKERDSAVSQLGVAYFTTEQLKAENLTLKDENARLDSDLAKLRASLRNQNSESTRIKDVSRKKSDQQLKTAQAAPRLSHGNNHGRSHNGHSLKTGVGEGSSAQVPIDNENRRLQGSELKVNKKLVKSSDPHKVSGERKQRKTRVVVDEYSESEASDASVDGPNFEADQTNTHSETLPQRNEIPETTDGDAGDITFLSFLESGEIAKLRRTLEQERMARKQRHGQNGNPTKEIDDAIQQNPVEPTVPLPRKSSMKDLSGRPSIQIADNQHNLDLTSHSKISTTHNGRHSEHSLLEQRNQRQGLGMEDMTSAFIVPDITIRNPGPFTNANPKLSTATQQVFDVIATHIGENCTVCKRVLGSGATHNHDETVKETIKIHKPTPVSERMPEANLYEEEPTMRPSQPPPIALATVIKGLKDELVHLKIQLSQDQSLYDRHDPALSKRKRKSVLSKIEKLIQAVDSKSDQIYALYDVLEGQKADGHEISEEEVEMTLQSVGIDLAGLGLRGGDLFKEDEKKEQRPAWDLDSSDESGEDLPWEGFEVTGDITRRSGESRRRSWGA